MDTSKLPLVAVVGLTASGKSGFSLQLAAALGERGVACEIISADAFQLYRGMDIGTAKVTREERGGIPHHLLDVLELAEKASVAAYQRSCRQVIEQIRTRKALPILVGGSGLYVRAALDKIEFPGTDRGIRARLEAQAAQLGIEKMHQRLAEVDPESAVRIVPANERRVIRALEVYELTGKKFSATMPRREYFQPAVQLGIKWPLAVLDERISQRTAQMLTQGFIEEVAELEKQGLADTPTACRATGYQAVMDYLAGKISREDTAEQIALQTRQLARKQRKWFRKDPRIHWLDGEAGTSKNLEQALALLEIK
ncbi:tRNA (adenosine(37)-N6)-dimethylallyltransferase MiaA [Varibaculum cambriense]|uniref:tRNA (adenosine(37)-N6)-dimethylallyltransferase MiaA n=1 Tax=Varibaculum cambriense TaxID=184870 RepID=UPI0028FF460B|nr:tRNA (adenosine(37)-N6)-dimethylallyltransferase MiaA [Varibaculum cambriense]MDU1224280.1 tRNA (adenosine(37)-N6)-dimethylallyltransferase MiaA [Varibaculum cambriense]